MKFIANIFDLKNHLGIPVNENEVIKTILNVKDNLLGKMIVFNSLKTEFRNVKLSKNPNCIKECVKR